jgi:hypothetical protein
MPVQNESHESAHGWGQYASDIAHAVIPAHRGRKDLCSFLNHSPNIAVRPFQGLTHYKESVNIQNIAPKLHIDRDCVFIQVMNLALVLIRVSVDGRNVSP